MALLCNTVYSWDNLTTHVDMTHQGLTYLIDTGKLPPCAKTIDEFLSRGARDEDIPVARSWFHFDPALNSSYATATCNSIQWGFGNGTYTGALVSPLFSWTMSNSFNWDVASTNAGKEKGWVALGHMLHLLKDLGVPAHVRNDPHPVNEPLEHYARGRAPGLPLGLMTAAGPQAFFNDLGNYIRSNFFSNDTCFDLGQPGPTAVTEDQQYFYDGSGNRIAYKGIRYYLSGGNREYCSINDAIAAEQYNRIGPLSVMYAASLINYYYEQHKNEISFNLVINGSFEIGDFSGWNTGFLYGCDFPGYGTPSGYTTVIAGNATDGTYSARLGRWDQIYTGGLYGPPAPGTEPCGYDYIYQDIKTPSGTTLSFNFSYNIQTFDTAVWDWLDVFVTDPTNGMSFATVVSQDGKPGYDYGVYWNGGINNVTFDLTPFAGQTIRLWMGNRQDGWGDQTAVWIDNVFIECK